MKKLLVIAVAALGFGLFSNTSSAQGISVELDLGYNTPGGDFADLYDAGVGLAIHPRLKLNDKMAVGLSLGSNGFVGGDLSGAGGSISAAGIVTVLGTVQYKLLGKKISPYGELGIGMFSGKILTADVINNGGTEESISNFGFAPEVGVMIGFLNASVTYAMAGDIKYTQFGLGFRFGAK